jgi:Molecular chaperone (small heat shock protein)
MTDTSNPLAEVEEIINQLAELNGAPNLPVDLVDTGDELVVLADLPGRDGEELSVSLSDDRTLEIAADKRTSAAGGRRVINELVRGPVERSVTLPAAVEPAKTTASYDGGVLQVTLTKRVGDDNGTEITVE